MDLNDPRRRLQVLNNASPSIRIASQPQQKLTVAKAPTQPQPQISIAQPKQYNIAVPKAPAVDPNVPNYSNKFKGLTNEGTETKKLFGLDVGRFMGDYGKITKLGVGRDYESSADDFIASYDKLGDDARRIYVDQVIKKAKEGDQVALNTAKTLNDRGKLGGTFSDFLEAANNKAFGWTMNAANFGHQKDVQGQLDNFTAGQIGKEFDPITVGTDIGLTIAGGAGAAKLLSKIPAAQRIIAAGGTGAKVLPFLADSVGGGLTQEAISQARGRETSLVQDLATGTAIDAGANLVFKGAGKFTNLFRQGQKSSSVVDDIIKEADPARIQQVMKIDNNLANYLAQETNPDTVKEVLRQMEMDPNIQLPDEVRKRLEEEGISAVRKKDNQYGAEYDPNDSSINFKDQSFATDANAYHELGHNIFKNKLTPEEQALFKGSGEASQKASGREGYSPDDINSEDFSDYMQKALTGRIKEVPEELRPVIAKYAKTAANDAEDIGIAGAKGADAPSSDFTTSSGKVKSRVNQEIADQGLVDGSIFEKKLSDLKLGPNTDPTEAPDMAQVAKYIDDISNGKPIDPVIVERGPNGELLVDDGKHRLEALKALGIEDVPVIEKGVKSTAQTPEQAVGDVAKANTGVSDAAPDGSVKTTSPEDAGTTFSNKNEYYHGSTNDKLSELDTGANLGLNEKRNLVYLSDTEKGAAPYMKNRAADGTLSDSPTGKMYKVSLDGKVVDATDSNALASLKSLPGYDDLDSLTKRHINNAESLNYLDPDILENNPDLVKFLSDNGIKGIRTDLPNSPGDTQVIALDKGATKLLNGEKATPTVDEIVPNADPDTKKAIQEVLDNLNGAQKNFDDAAPDGSVKTTSPEDSGTTFANQLDTSTENGANALKTAENNVQANSVNDTPIEANVASLVDRDTNPEDVQAILDAASRARGNYKNVLNARSQQHAMRANDAMRVFDESGGGEEGYKAMLSKLGGKYAESAYTPLSVEKEVSDRIINSVKKSNLQDWEKFNTMTSLQKLWGSVPAKPAEHDYQYIRRFFNEQYGDGVGDALEQELKEAISKGKSIGDIASEISGLPRALMATGDLSGGFRQGMPLGTRYPRLWADANRLSVEWAFRPEKYNAAMKEIADSPSYNVISDKLGVDLTGVGAMQDEAFIGAGIAEKIPGFGHVVKGADRAYTGVLTKLRFDVANDIINKAGGPEQFVKNMEEIYGNDIVGKGLFGRTTSTRSDRAMRAYGEFINTFSGRGGMKGGVLDQHMQTASTFLFAPRLWAANLNRLNPFWYARLYRDNPAAAKLAMQSQGTFMLMAASVLGLAAAAGAEVGSDPRSADFGKIKVGNTRYDILGGQQQNIVQFARQWTGEKVDSTTGKVDTLGDGYGVKTRFDLALDMLENKSNPLVAFGIKLMETADGDTGNYLQDQFIRKDKYGNDFNVGENALRLGIPLGLQGAYDTSVDVGDPVKGSLLNAPSFFGVGVQTYGETPTKDSNGKIAFGGKIKDNMVLDKNGEVFMDEKNRPVRVKFAKDASEAEKKAALKKAQNEAYTKKAKSLLSQEDADLYATGQADLSSLDETQKAKFDQIKKWVSDYGKEVDIPKSVKSDAAKNFYSKYNTMTKKDQEAWLKESPDENAKTVATELNKQRVKGLPEYKPSNYLSKEYAEYEKDLLEHPEYTNIDKQNKARAFQAKAYKYNYSEDQRDIFNEGGSSDLKSLIDDGQISKEDLSAAIKLDEELYNSGLTGSLKFSKKFRNTYGYGTPAGRGGSGGSGSGESKRAYLSAYVNNGTEGAKKEAPQFSSKRRTQGISFKDVSTPKKSNSKKVTINL